MLSNYIPLINNFQTIHFNFKMYYHGESIAVNVHISNRSNKTVKKIKMAGKLLDLHFSYFINVYSKPTFTHTLCLLIIFYYINIFLKTQYKIYFFCHKAFHNHKLYYQYIIPIYYYYKSIESSVTWTKCLSLTGRLLSLLTQYYVIRLLPFVVMEMHIVWNLLLSMSW